VGDLALFAIILWHVRICLLWVDVIELEVVCVESWTGRRVSGAHGLVMYKCLCALAGDQLPACTHLHFDHSQSSLALPRH
jgi:hypothetical protein